MVTDPGLCRRVPCGACAALCVIDPRFLMATEFRRSTRVFLNGPLSRNDWKRRLTIGWRRLDPTGGHTWFLAGVFGWTGCFGMTVPLTRFTYRTWLRILRVCFISRMVVRQ